MKQNNNKRIIRLVTLLMVGFLSIVNSFAFKYEGLSYEILSREKKEVKVYNSGTNYYGHIEIPSQVEYDEVFYTVVSIDQYTFKDNDIESVTIPNTVKEIGFQAFSGSNLKSFTVTNVIDNPDITIGIRAFEDCKSLEDIEFANSVTSIGEYAFRDCHSLRHLDFLDGVRSLGANCFVGCVSLVSVSLPSSLESIGKEAFRDCGSLENFEVSEGNQFYSSMNGILYDKNRTILICWPPMKGNETIPSSVKTIGESALYPNNVVTSLVLPEGLEVIEQYAFRGCSKLEEIILPSSLTYMDAYSIYHCPEIKSLYLPENVFLYSWLLIFQDCPSLASIEVSPDNPYYSSYDSVLYDKEGELLIRCPPAKEEISFPETVTSLRMYAFHGSNIPKIILPETVSKMDYGIFSSSKALKSITMLGEIKGIWGETFAGCNDLDYVDLPASVTGIAAAAFAGCGGTINKFICRAPVPPYGSGCWSEQGDSHQPPRILTYINTLYVPAESVELYMVDSDWGAVARNIFPIEDEPGGVPGLGDEPAETDFTVYSLTGILLLKNASKEAISTLPSGIYIINGKKVAL